MSGRHPPKPVALARRPAGLAIATLFMSVLAVVVPAATGRQQRLRDDRAKRSEMYLELVERYGLWVVDRTYHLLETSHEDYLSGMPTDGRSNRSERFAFERGRS